MNEANCCQLNPIKYWQDRICFYNFLKISYKAFMQSNGLVFQKLYTILDLNR